MMNLYQILFYLACAAEDWLRENPNNPNAESVREALREYRKMNTRGEWKSQ